MSCLCRTGDSPTVADDAHSGAPVDMPKWTPFQILDEAAQKRKTEVQQSRGLPESNDSPLTSGHTTPTFQDPVEALDPYAADERPRFARNGYR